MLIRQLNRRRWSLLPSIAEKDDLSGEGRRRSTRLGASLVAPPPRRTALLWIAASNLVKMLRGCCLTSSIRASMPKMDLGRELKIADQMRIDSHGSCGMLRAAVTKGSQIRMRAATLMRVKINAALPNAGASTPLGSLGLFHLRLNSGPASGGPKVPPAPNIPAPPSPDAVIHTVGVARQIPSLADPMESLVGASA